MIYLDAGDGLAKVRMWSPEPDKDEIKRHMVRAELVMDLLKEAGVDAMAVGHADLLLGHKAIKKLATAKGIKVLSGNLQDKAGKEVFPGSVLVEKQGKKIGVLAITMPQANLNKRTAKSGLKFADPVETSKALVKKLKDDGAELIVLLSAADHKDTKKVLGASPEINLALVSGRGGWLQKPQRSGKSFMVGVPPGGKYVGKVEIYQKGDSLDLEDVSERYELQDRIERLMGSCSGYEKMLSRAKGPRKDRFEKRLASMQKNILRFIEQLKEKAEKVPQGGYFSNRRVSLDNKVKDDSIWAKRLKDAKKEHSLDRRGRRMRGRMPPGRRNLKRSGRTPRVRMNTGANAMSLPPGER